MKITHFTTKEMGVWQECHILIDSVDDVQNIMKLKSLHSVIVDGKYRHDETNGATPEQDKIGGGYNMLKCTNWY